MKNLLVVTHGALAVGFCSALDVIVGNHDNVATICIGMDDAVETIQKQVSDYCLARGNETIIIMSDIPGGSSTSVAYPVIADMDNVHFISGVNLGLLLELSVGDYPSVEQIEEVVENARNSLMFIK